MCQIRIDCPEFGVLFFYCHYDYDTKIIKFQSVHFTKNALNEMRLTIRKKHDYVEIRIDSVSVTSCVILIRCSSWKERIINAIHLNANTHHLHTNVSVNLRVICFRSVATILWLWSFSLVMNPISMRWHQSVRRKISQSVSFFLNPVILVFLGGWRIIVWLVTSTRYIRWPRDPDNKVYGAKMGPNWVLSAPDWPPWRPHEPCYQAMYTSSCNNTYC